MKKPKYELVTTSMGVTSIRDNDVNEILHNPVGPWREANELYVKQCRLAQRLSKSPIVLFDVGLGAAANALAALHCQAQQPETKKTLTVVSFEKDLSLLEFALENASHFEHFQGYESALSTLLTKKAWIAPHLNAEWFLREGDFTALIQKEPQIPNIIFYDPYSPKSNQDMWSLSCLKELYRQCAKAESAELYTYSQSTSIRYKLLSAGFFVGAGEATGLKAETTVASTRFENLTQPLGPRWAERLLRSESPELKGEGENVKKLLTRHEQFKAQPTRN